DVSTVDMTTEILGVTFDSPIVIAPTSSNRAFHPDGEIAVAKAARAGNHLQILSTVATISADELNHYIEGFVRMVDNNILRPDRGKTIATVIFYPFGKAGGERRKQQVRPLWCEELTYIRKRHHAVDDDDVLVLGAGLPDDKVAQTIRRAR